MSETQDNSSRKNYLRPVILAILVGISVFFSALFIISPYASPERNSVADREIKGDAVPVDAAALRASSRPASGRYDFRLSAADTFYSVMSLFNVSGPEIQKIALMAKGVFDVRQIKIDTVLRVITADDRVERIEYMLGAVEGVAIKRDNGAEGGWSASKFELPNEYKRTRVTGSIENSLYEAGVKAGADPQAIMAMTDIFAWDVDFTSEIRKGDTFSILYDVLYVEGRPVKAGGIAGAEMVNAGRKYIAVRYTDAGGKPGYYDPEGKSLRRTLLKSPLRYRRITSYFSKRRFHPILRTFRPHHGIDYSAPKGTPVEAAGSGKVIYAGWKSGYGNFIEIKHRNGYVTGYGHLSRINRGVRAGATVDQGDVVGYVGSTGISTGPHLHYEIHAAGRLINPLSIKAEPDKAVAITEFERFASMRDETLRMLAGMTEFASAKPAPEASRQGNTPGAARTAKD
ncbi:MAG: peptidoglycan DD-metalloendopeptidase family protein, partial [Deltaproteobacteria bacterium]|nr:peptidoglycan DD-metalloendopeptidase family protein [Deltaproteobacteria bacterium]